MSGLRETTTAPWEIAIGRLSYTFGNEAGAGGLSPGDKATLRRLDREGVLPPAFWRQLVALGLQGRESEERAWASLMAVMLEGSISSTGLSIGRALSGRGEKTPYAEQRFVRLLRARGLTEVGHEARQAARWCASRGTGLTFHDRYARNGFGRFILAATLHGPDVEDRAQAIARDYFTHQGPDA